MTQIPGPGTTNCPNCGAAVPDAAAACPTCGFARQSAASPVYPQSPAYGQPVAYGQAPGQYAGPGWGPGAAPAWGAWPAARPKTTNLKMILIVVVTFKVVLLFGGLLLYIAISLGSR